MVFSGITKEKTMNRVRLCIEEKGEMKVLYETHFAKHIIFWE